MHHFLHAKESDNDSKFDHSAELCIAFSGRCNPDLRRIRWFALKRTDAPDFPVAQNFNKFEWSAPKCLDNFPGRRGDESLGCQCCQVQDILRVLEEVTEEKTGDDQNC
jgi:hypothetical protein